MNNGFLPVSRAEMEERGIKQFDFVYVIGDALRGSSFVSVTPLSQDFWKHTAIRSELSRSRTGEIRSLSVSSGSRGSGF